MSRKRTRRKVYPLVNVLTHVIEGVHVTEQRILDRLRLTELSAIEAFATGRATRHDWMALADLSNVAETLARSGVGPEALAACERAQDALGEARRRHGEHGRFELTPAELEAMRELYAFADLQRTSITRAEYERAIQRTAQRIRSAPPDAKVMV
jgi:hypothetical protein